MSRLDSLIRSKVKRRGRGLAIRPNGSTQVSSGGGGLGVYGPRVVTKTIAVRFFASGPSKEPLPPLQSLFTTCPGRSGLYAYSLFLCIPGEMCTRTEKAHKINRFLRVIMVSYGRLYKILDCIEVKMIHGPKGHKGDMTNRDL